MRWLDSITDSMGMILGKLQEIMEDGGAWRVVVHKVAESDTIYQLISNKKFLLLPHGGSKGQ